MSDNTKSKVQKNKNSIGSMIWEYKYVLFIIFVSTFIVTYILLPINSSSKTLKGDISEHVAGVYHYFEDKANSKLKKNEEYITALILGIDSRELEFDGKAFYGENRNTDVILQIIYDTTHNNIFMISIPRDTGYKVEETCANQTYDKAINRLYKYGEDGKCIGGGLGLISKYTSKITGMQNNYFALISFETFYDFFESIGDKKGDEYGLWIDIPANVYEMYPFENGYIPFNLTKGYQFLNSDQLLKYARSRQNTSDFMRARRQQVVIETVKNRVFDKVANDPSSVLNIYNSFRKNALYSDLSIEEIVAIMTIADTAKTANIYHIVLDDTLGGQNRYLMKPAYSPPFGIHERAGYYLTPVAYSEECCTEDNFVKVKKYIKSIISSPEVYDESTTVVIYNNKDSKELPINIKNWLDLEPAISKIEVSKYDQSLTTKDMKMYLIDWTDGKKFNSLNYLKETLSLESTNPKEIGAEQIGDEDFSIIIN